MSMVQCPECGSKISDKAKVCSYCGFMSKDSSRPISEQDKFEIAPVFEYEIEEWNPYSAELIPIPLEDNRVLIHYFGKFEMLAKIFPSLAENIKALLPDEKVFAARLDSFTMGLIEKGELKFSLDKNGELLPTLRGSKGWAKNIRLEEMDLSPDLAQTLSNLTTHALMAQTMDAIGAIEESIKELKAEFQSDRIAIAESSRDKLLQAQSIHDTRLREAALLNAINSATDAKRQLMRSFEAELRAVDSDYGKSMIDHIRSFKDTNDQKAIIAFQNLIAITNAVQIECEGYMMLGEYEAGKKCLAQFKSFIENAHLDDRDTLLMLNESLGIKQTNVVDDFSQLAKRITSLDTPGQLKNGIIDVFEGGDGDDSMAKEEDEDAGRQGA